MSRFALALALSFVGATNAASLEAVVRDPSGKPVADTVIYAASSTTPPEARPGKTIAIEQVDREFVPYVSVIQTGTTVTFPNRDPILHHVYSFSPAKSFEIKLYSGKSPVEVLFDKPGVVTVGCNIHDWMIAYIMVVPTPYFARTDASGAARLRDLPPGTYEVRAWNPQQKTPAEARSVTLDPAGNAQLSLVVDTVPRKPKYKPPFDKLKY